MLCILFILHILFILLWHVSCPTVNDLVVYQWNGISYVYICMPAWQVGDTLFATYRLELSGMWDIVVVYPSVIDGGKILAHRSWRASCTSRMPCLARMSAAADNLLQNCRTCWGWGVSNCFVDILSLEFEKKESAPLRSLIKVEWSILWCFIQLK
jgi:hypothetical protein